LDSAAIEWLSFCTPPFAPPAGVCPCPSGFRDSVASIREAYDAQLLAALRAALQLMEAPPGAAKGAPGGGVTSPLARYGSSLGGLGRGPAGGTGPALDEERAAVLQPYLQEQCLGAVMGLAAALEAQLAALPAPAPGPTGAPAVEQALLVGRLCSALSGASEALPAVLGPPAAWAAAATAAAGGTPARPAVRADPSAAAAGAGAVAPLARVGARLSGIAAAAYGTWARWAAGCIAADLAAAYCNDPARTCYAAPLSWVETVVSVGRGSGGNGDDGYGLAPSGGGGAMEDDMRFPLPAAPSPAMLSALMAACWVSGAARAAVCCERTRDSCSLRSAAGLPCGVHI
jgi:hypothetical protein